MGQPNPPGDLPLVEGLGVEWNDIVSALPEDRRAELGPKLKERISSYEPLKQWEEFNKSGVTPDQADIALRVYSAIETDPKSVYEALANHLNITPAQAKEVVKEVEKQGTENPEDPRLATLQDQINTMSQILLGQRQMSAQEQLAKEQDAAIEKELSDVKAKYGEFPEQEIVMRMVHKDMTAEQAFQEYTSMVSELRKRPPAPYIMGQGTAIPKSAIDPVKLSTEDTKSLVTQMMQQAQAQK